MRKIAALAIVFMLFWFFFIGSYSNANRYYTTNYYPGYSRSVYYPSNIYYMPGHYYYPRSYAYGSYFRGW
jgi:hypothetical protein